MPRTRTNIEIDDDKLQRVMQRYHLATKTEAVDFALEQVAGRVMTRAEVLAMSGANLTDHTPADRPVHGVE